MPPPMNPERPNDPREQMEVRLTALLLGEASAFEEAELLEAIKHDPALAAYYEEMRVMVKQVEAAVQSAPMETVGEHPRLADDKRAQLETLFKQSPLGTIQLESIATLKRRVTRLQTVMSIAAALMILFVAAGLLLPALAKSKAKASRIALRSEPAVSPMVGDFDSASGAFGETRIRAGGAGYSTNRGVNPVQPALRQRELSTWDEKSDSPADLDEGFLHRYGSSISRSEPKLKNGRAELSASSGGATPAKGAKIFLPAADDRLSTADAYSLAANPAAKEGATSQRSFSSVRLRLADSGLAAANKPASAPEPMAPAAAADLFAAQDLARTGSESVVQLPHNQPALGRKSSSEHAVAQVNGPQPQPLQERRSTSARLDAAAPELRSKRPSAEDFVEDTRKQITDSAALAGTATDASVAVRGKSMQAADEFNADFGILPAKPQRQAADNNSTVAHYFAENGVATSTDLFAKQTVDPKSVDRLNRLAEEESLGLAYHDGD